MKTDFVQLVAEATGKSHANAEKDMRVLKERYGITYRQYYKETFFRMTPTQALYHAKFLKRKRLHREGLYAEIARKTGQTRKEIIQDIIRINEKDICRIDVVMYYKWMLYDIDEETLNKKLQLLEERKNVREVIRAKLNAIDEGTMEYSALDEDVKAAKILVRSLLTENLRCQVRKQIVQTKVKLPENRQTFDDLVVDMEMMRFFFGYSFDEYLLFDFMGKSLEERYEFLSNRERLNVLSQLNEIVACDLFNNKHQCYLRLYPFFKRVQVCIRSHEDYEKFRNFCEGRLFFVKKPLVDAMGRGVELISIGDNKNTASLMTDILKETGPFVAEEYIRMHRRLRCLNPDSVNTVRIETYYNDGNPIVVATFARMGRSGSFVDNGNAGGLMASVDPVSGRIIANACDKHGNVYTCHPDTKIQLQGYKLPRWKQALKLATKLSKAVPEVKYVGWDLTCNRWGQWVVVEGNSRPQGHQASMKKGIRKAFYQAIGKRPSEFR